MKKKRVIRLLEDALRHSRMETADFAHCGRTDDFVIPNEQITEFIRNETELWRQTWISSYIERALELIKEGKP